MSFYVNSVNDNVTCTINSHFMSNVYSSIFCNCFLAILCFLDSTTKYMTQSSFILPNSNQIPSIKSVISVVYVGYIFSDLESVLFNFRK